MRTRSAKVSHPNKHSIDMAPIASSSGITSPTDFLIPEILKIRPVNTLGQRINMIEVERRDQDRNEDRQPNKHREDKINKNYDWYENDDRYL